MKTARATPRVLPLPDLAPGCKRFEVDCRYATTGLTWVPGPVDLPDEDLALMAAYTREERCGACGVWPVPARGDGDLRAMAERAPTTLGAAITLRRRV